jgi:hypothetical protein
MHALTSAGLSGMSHRYAKAPHEFKKAKMVVSG